MLVTVFPLLVGCISDSINSTPAPKRFKYEGATYIPVDKDCLDSIIDPNAGSFDNAMDQANAYLPSGDELTATLLFEQNLIDAGAISGGYYLKITDRAKDILDDIDESRRRTAEFYNIEDSIFEHCYQG